MRALASFTLRGRSQATMAATVLAMLALVMPLLSIPSSAVVALVTLRKGSVEGLLVGVMSSLATGVLAFLLLGSPVPVIGFLLVLWMPVWAIGGLLRSSRSLGMALQAGAGFGLLLILVLYIQLGDPRAQWMEILQPLAEGFVESQLLEVEQSQVFVQFMAGWMTGIFAAGFYFQLILAMLLARAWQAGLYNPGGFREEFHTLDIGRPLGLVALVLFGLALVLGEDSSTLARELALLLAPLFLLQGLAVAHRIVAVSGMSIGWLAALYLLLFFAVPHAALIVIFTGLLDVFVDFRGRLKQDSRPDS